MDWKSHPLCNLTERVSVNFPFKRIFNSCHEQSTECTTEKSISWANKEMSWETWNFSSVDEKKNLPRRTRFIESSWFSCAVAPFWWVDDASIERWKKIESLNYLRYKTIFHINDVSKLNIERIRKLRKFLRNLRSGIDLKLIDDWFDFDHDEGGRNW